MFGCALGPESFVRARGKWRKRLFEAMGALGFLTAGFLKVLLKCVVTRVEARGLRWAHETPGGSRMEVAKPP